MKTDFYGMLQVLGHDLARLTYAELYTKHAKRLMPQGAAP
jgi:hypothetical protein